VRRLLKSLKETISNKGEVLFFPGCTTQHCTPHINDKYKEILSDIGISHITIKDLKCCGSPLINAGYQKEFDEIKAHNKRLMKKHNVKTIITNAPHCYRTLKKHYGINTKHILEVINEQKHKLINNHDEEMSYHDSCVLAKNNIIDEPRAILKATGIKLNEPQRNKKDVFCCGASGGLKQNNPSLSNKIAKERLKHFKTKKIVVSCPYCYLHFKENTKDKKILDISEVINP